MSCCAACTIGFLDLKHRAFALGAQVSAEWSRCLGSMARRARDSVTPRSSTGWIPRRIGRLTASIGRRHPVTIIKASLMVGLVRQVWTLRNQTGTQISAVECTIAKVTLSKVVAPAPQQAASRVWRAVSGFCDAQCQWLTVLVICEWPVQLYSEAGPALAGAGPNARNRRGAPLSSGVLTSSCSVNRAMTFLLKIF